MSSSKRSHIPPNPPRWKPNPDPASIVIPGLDIDASMTDQIEQIEQLITIKLQNIDENFSKIHNVLAMKLLPAIKRYAVGTEPVREAAKFWTSFYEQAAQIRIPTFDDYSTVNETPSEHGESEPSTQERSSDAQSDQTARTTQDIYETSVVNSETSFLPGQGAISSTPAMSRSRTAASSNPNDTFASQNSDPSWTPSMESPIVRLNREISNLSTHQADESLLPSTSTAHISTRDHDSTISSTFRHDASVAPRSEKGKGKDPLLKNVLRHNLYSASDNSSFESKQVSPLKFRGKPKTPTINKNLNPYLRAQASPAEWSGVVDLRDPSTLTPQKYRSDKSRANETMKTPYDDDDSFDGLPPGMSPPVLMSPARPPRSSAELGLLKLGQTPARDASTRIQRDLLRSPQLQSGGKPTKTKLFGTTPGGYYESSMSTVSSPPSLSRYNRNNRYANSSNSITKDSSLESMIRHIQEDIRPNVGATPGMASTPGLRLRPRPQSQTLQSHAPSQPRLEPQRQPQQPQLYTPEPPPPATPLYPQHMHAQEQDQDLDSDSDSLDIDEVNTTAHPSAAFLMASQGRPRAYGDDDEEDSFGSSNHSSDSLVDEVAGDAGIVPVHPFAGAGHVVEDDGFDDDDDSFDGFEPGHGGVVDGGDGGFTETVFGVAPAQRMQMQTGGHGGQGGLRMLGQDLFDDTIGVGAQRAANGLLDESPTPASWRD